MEEYTYCLGIKAFGLCNYNPLKPNAVYFSIGEAIAAIALLLAFSQLMTPELRFRIKIHNIKARIAVGLFLSAIVFVLIAAMLPSILGYVVPVVGFPVFWEFLAGLSIFTGVLLLLRIYLSKAVFNASNYKQYFNACFSFIVRGDEISLRALADEIRVSAPAIVDAAYKYDSFRANEAKDTGEQTEYALALLGLFSDERFCAILVNAAPGTALDFVQEFIKHGSREKAGYALVQQVVKQAFISNNSMLHREEDYYGLGHFKTFTRTVFGNYQFIQSGYRPLQAWPHWQEEFNTKEIIEKYSRALQISFEAYFAAADFGQYPAALYVAVRNLAESPQFKMAKLKGLTEECVYETDAFEANRAVSNAFKALIEIVATHQDKIPQYEFDETNYDRLKDYSIYGVLAEGIYEFLEMLAIDRKHDEAIRTLAIDLWLLVDPLSERSKTVEEIQKRLLIRLKKKINDNLEHLSYPMITRLLINLIGLHDAGSEGSVPERFARKELHALLKEKFITACEMDEEKAKDILPCDVQFIKESCELVQEKKRFKETYRLKLQ